MVQRWEPSSPGTLVFPSPKKSNQHFQIAFRPGIRELINRFVDVLPLNNYLFICNVIWLTWSFTHSQGRLCSSAQWWSLVFSIDFVRIWCEPQYIKIVSRTWAADRLLCACAQKKRKEKKWEKEKAGKANMSAEGAETMHLLYQAY